MSHLAVCRHLVAASLFITICTGASHRSQNFIVHARSQAFARQVADTAEKLRDQLAADWLGRRLPPWRDKCPIYAKAGNLPAGGETSFTFRRGVAGNWEMKIWGTRERILDSVLPHEITHTVFATHFRQPLPRWADEGACTTVEAAVERHKHEHNLIRFLKTEQGIPFARMFAMRQYPRNILPLYAQGYSVARFLIAQGGKRQFVRFVGAGLQSNRWSAAVRRYYRYQDLSDLQLHWNRWVAKGCPALKPQQKTPQRPVLRVASTKRRPGRELRSREQPGREQGSPGQPATRVSAPPASSGNYYLKLTRRSSPSSPVTSKRQPGANQITP